MDKNNLKGRLVLMFEWLGEWLGKSKRKIEQLWGREVDDSMEQGNASQQAPSDSVRSLLKQAIADAEQIVASIKVRAQTEAEAEASRIITQAELEAQEIEGGAKIAAQKEVEGILSAASRKAEIAAAEAAVPPSATPAPTETELTADTAPEEKVEEPVQLQEEAIEEKVEEPVQLQEEAIEEKVEEPAQLQEEAIVSEEEVKSAPLKLESQALYTGEVELVIASSVELKLVSRLYNYLQTVPELRILYTRGSWDQGTTITVVLEKPIPLINIISEAPGIEVTPELLEKGGLAEVKSSSPLRGGEKRAGRIKLNLQEA